MRDWPEPGDRHELMQFLGLANYYRKFVRNFTDIAAPMTALLRKEVPHEWSEECRQAFESLKAALTSAPVLSIPDPGGDFEMSTDASNVGIGAELTQNGRPVLFFSRKLRNAEVNYATHDKEALAIIEAVREWRVCLLGRHVKVYTDHNSLKNVFSQPNLNQRQRLWLEELADYDLEVRYKPGKSNVVADALSRRPDYLLASMSAVVPSQDYLSVLREYWKENAPEGDKYFEKDGLFYEKRQDHELRMMIPAVPETEQLRRMIMSEVHDCAYSGHLGFDKTLEMVKRTVVWRGMHEEVKSCGYLCHLPADQAFHSQEGRYVATTACA